MLRRLFGFIGRKKRVDRKMAYIGRLIGQLEGRKKVDYALEVAEIVTGTKSNKKLEEIADFYIAQLEKALEQSQGLNKGFAT